MKRVSFFVARKEDLFKLRLRAMRSGVWFKVLSRIDRAVMNLTIKVVHGVRSSTLARIVFSVVKKLEDALENRFLNALQKVGLPLARKLSSLAQKWGNISARDWALDLSFAKFLAMMYMNNPAGFRP